MKRLASQEGYDFDKQVCSLQKAISKDNGFRLQAENELIDCIYATVLNDYSYVNGECIEIDFSF